MNTVGVSVKDLVKLAHVIIGISDAYDNEETVKGCYDFHDTFKAMAKDFYIKSKMNVDEKNFICQISRDLRDERIAEIMAIHEDDDDED